MRRALLPAAVLALLVAVALILASALGRPGALPLDGGAARVEQVDTSAYPQITLYVSVRDEDGQPLGGLGSADFAVTEDGAPVELADFAGGGAAPVTAALVVDRSGSMEDDGKIDGAREAAAAFVELMRPGDRAALVAFNDRVELAEPFGEDSEALGAAIGGLRADGGTALYDAVVAGVELLRDEPGRRLLLVLSDGQDCSARFDGCPDEYGSERTLAEAIAFAQEAGQPVAVVGLGDRAAGGQGGIDEAVLRRIAAETGGRYFYAPRAEDLAGLYAELAGDVQQEYRLTYVSPRPFYDGTRRDIQVRAGASVAAGGYTERHLINVVASPLVGVALLVPLAGLLVLPAALRRRRAAGAAPASQGAGPARALVEGRALPTQAAPALSSQPGPALAATGASGGSAGALPAVFVAPAGGQAPGADAGGRRCAGCAGPLRETARFCPACGATQPVASAPVAERRTFCDMCGRPVEAGAKFCIGCGEPVAGQSEG